MLQVKLIYTNKGFSIKTSKKRPEKDQGEELQLRRHFEPSRAVLLSLLLLMLS
jgi:hypothetical protein